MGMQGPFDFLNLLLSVNNLSYCRNQVENVDISRYICDQDVNDMQTHK